MREKAQALLSALGQTAVAANRMHTAPAQAKASLGPTRAMASCYARRARAATRFL
jgi:hypothetical protein